MVTEVRRLLDFLLIEASAEDLVNARAKLVEERRACAKKIAGPYKRGETEDARQRIVELQTIIEAIDRALEDGSGAGRFSCESSELARAKKPASASTATPADNPS
jgi:hypothetical protein